MENQNQIQRTELQTIKDELLSQRTLAMFKDALPNAAGIHAEESAMRFAKMVCVVISEKPALQTCTVKSIIKAASISASLDLDIDPRGLAYLVPYKNHGVMEAQFQIGYMGLIDLAYRSGKVKAISAHCLYESEKGSVTITRINGQYSIEHPFSYQAPTGPIVATYAIAEVEGFGPQTCVLRADEVEIFRKFSKAPNSPAWKDHYPAMCKKTTIRQLAKFLPKSILKDFSRGAALDERESFVQASHTAQSVIDAETGSQIIGAEPQLAPENPQEAPQNGKPAFMEGVVE